MTVTRVTGALPLLLALGSACPSNGPQGTSSSGTTAGLETTTTAAASSDDDPDTTWALPDPDFGAPMPSQTSTCAQYIECAQALMDTQLDAIEAMYGPDAACWQGTAPDAALCDVACSDGLAQLVAQAEANGQAAPEPCEPPQITWSDLEQLIGNRCVDGCHEPGGDDESLDLSDEPYNAMYLVTSDQSPLFLVDPGDREGSYLWHKLAGSHGAVGGMGGRMPKDEPPLPAITVEGIARWIDDGASSF